MLFFQNQFNERAKFPCYINFISNKVPLCFIGKHCDKLNIKFYRALEDNKLRLQDISVHGDLSKVEKSVGESEDFQLPKFFGETPGRFLVNQINTLKVKRYCREAVNIHSSPKRDK